jgi:diadenosine tetraphosphate (Ap4A) HIT family hydrolase
VFRVEAALRICLQPEKVNLASLGNMTPHLHWHVIPRRSGDPTFPQPIWAAGIAPSLQVDTLGSTPGTHNGVIALEWKSAVIEALNS